MYTADIKKLPRHFVPSDFTVTDWQSLEPLFNNLLDRNIDTKENLEQWLKDQSELEALVNEDACWRQIKMTCDTENKALEEAFTFFCMEIQPKIQPYADALNKKLVNHPLAKELDQEKYYTYLRSMRKSIELFREENIPIQAELAVMQQQYGVISGKMTVTVNDTEYTLQQAAKFLESPDRNLREAVYRKINERRLVDKEAMNALYDNLIEKRNQEASNAGFDN
jgi:oligoendopeptidase F